MTRDYGVKIYALLLIFSVFSLHFSCSSQNTPQKDLADYCIRQCVLETGDSEICDTQCKCAAEKVSQQHSDKDLVTIVDALNQEDNNNSDIKDMLKRTLESCKKSSE